MSGPTVVSRLAARGSAPALIDAFGAYRYSALVAHSCALAQRISHLVPAAATQARPPRVAYMCPRDSTYVQSQLATWHLGYIGVPIAENYPASEIEYVLRDCGVSLVLADATKSSAIGPVAAALQLPLLEVPRMPPCGATLAALLAATAAAAPEALAPLLPEAAAQPWGGGADGGAILIYTSGTTGRPKGVLTSHRALQRQVTALTEAWAWTAADHTYSVLPLHHVHAVVAILNSALWSGAVCELAPRFLAADTWAALTRPPGAPGGQLSVFMAVPTVYAKLLEHYDAQAPDTQAAWRAALRPPHSALRLMVSGSAALPQSIAQRWAEVSGQFLLERYGMTEFAMGISNPLQGARKLNSVGQPLPGYEVRLDAGAGGGGAPPEGFVSCGEIQVRGEGVFSEYWGKPQATAETFAEQGWFKTGDLGALDAQGYTYILGRLSADIIKSGGFKISALDIEREVLLHGRVGEVAVLGLPDETWGEKVAAVVALRGADEAAVAAAAQAMLATPGAAAAFHAELKEFLKDKLPP
jgi:malonyl-CoA/methylmalonyl-CoA synthetase